MKNVADPKILWTLAQRTLSHAVESPIAYIVALFFYGFIGGIFGLNYFINNQASITDIGMIAPWILWFVIPALTMGLIADELRSGTFEQLSTLPIRDWEIVLGKFLGFALLALFIIGGLLFYPIVIAFTATNPPGLDWAGSLGVVLGLYLLSLFYGSMGLFASSLAKNQVVALILGMIFCTFFFFMGQFYTFFPAFFARIADFIGVTSHLNTLARGVWDFRDLLYFLSGMLVFLYLAVQRLTTRRF